MVDLWNKAEERSLMKVIEEHDLAVDSFNLRINDVH